MWQLVDCGLDYITSTASTDAAKIRLTTYAHERLREEQKSGNEWKAAFFSGYTGFMCGSCVFGKRDDSVCLRISGKDADDAGRWIHMLCENVSRVDVQLTVLQPLDPMDVILEHENQAYRRIKKWKKKPEISLRRKNDGAHTLYFGKRCSNNFGRVYDKGRESGLPSMANTIRYERQINGKLAFSVFKAIHSGTDRNSRIKSEVLQYFRKKGLEISLPPVDIKQIVLARPECDADRKLRWLGSQVRPTVKFLLDYYEPAEIMETLGLNRWHGVPIGSVAIAAENPDGGEEHGDEDTNH